MKHSAEMLRLDCPAIGLRDEYPAGFVDPMHSHDHGQILYASAGVMSVRTPETSFVIPPQRALWLPAGTPHEVACRGPVSLRTLYLSAAVTTLRGECRAFEVSDLLRCLILEVVDFPPHYDPGGREGRLVALLLEEVDRMPDAPCRVTLPSDPRLLRVCQAILADPSDPRDIDDWASLAAMARRTLTRSFKRETGTSLAVWRQQVRLMEALSLLGAGASITQASFAVGYESPAAFATMFRRALGKPPARYLSQ
ncbi:helix-turn-helix transcriptional regulator [Sphingomonas psychrotolerans]|uniref:Helix-turn-helix transcriptional regulator n=1 Tax=Sphingomonas psychrotolerans TaxID=1327635 RepID=A0ABU3N8S6_9SPHN|nr:helix-turn-helix transcriptional regulator [Sphingomonas psychrotolerans]MDT8760920.1 helix-turn-helix transcriptional regulator [Sphingomonas psychrotolerans]